MKKWSEEKKDRTFTLVLFIMIFSYIISLFGFVAYLSYFNNPEPTSGISIPINYQKPNIDWHNVTVDWKFIRDGNVFKVTDDIFAFEHLGWLVTFNSLGHVIDYR